MTFDFKDGLIYGADYNPEQWSPQVWRDDVRLMQEAGVNLVSLGIFSWAQLEPREGEYDFAWLDEVMDLLHEGGVRVNLATATASPPPWLSLRYPASRPVTADGVRLEVGARQLYCPSDQDFRARAARLVREIAARYGTHPALRLWHVGNEYGCHIDQCFCEQCAAAFQAWLRERYGTLEALNHAWGTAFWSQRYGAWAEVQPPRRAPTFTNPSQGLDWRRFSSDNLLSLYRMERDALREVTPDVPLTTNFLGFLKGLDYFRWAQEEDVASLDAYPDPAGDAPHLEAGIAFDLTRSLRGGQRWILMEQATGAVNWRARNAPKRPGMMRALSHQALAHGADGIMFFQWRASVAGAEKYHSGMVGHVPPERSRVWREARDFGQELRTLGFLKGARVRARVGVMFDWSSWWALEQASQPAETPLMPQVQAWYAALRGLGVNVDFVPPDGDLSRYDVMTLPQQYLLGRADSERLRAYVRDGGTLVMGPYSAVVDEHDHVMPGGYPGLLQDVLGAWVEEWVPLQDGGTNHVTWADSGERTVAGQWCEVLHADGAEVLATFGEDYFAGGAAVTRHAFGQGRAYYLGTQLPHGSLQTLLAGALDAAGVPTALLPAHLDVTVSDVDGARLLHVVNMHPAQHVHLHVPGGRDAARPAETLESLSLAPYGVQIVQCPATFEVSDLRVTEAQTAPRPV
ncbi:beta-galactosidase [Deinococcus aquiradiocola]|uniref:Beta-galactosidase n=1 Tax=Deinococcus aquiradiocola TaxID=393059 RepID=A0A917UM02_9DEIO|nr:beta-galactosidase [Deinococcus aquiradiocola]GGJ66961.1 beta-galactosidase [Deinococcus aquiradiocola]